MGHELWTRLRRCCSAWTASSDDDPLGVDDLAMHHLPLEEAPAAYASFQKKQDGAIKVVFTP